MERRRVAGREGLGAGSGLLWIFAGSGARARVGAVVHFAWGGGGVVCGEGEG